MIVNSAKEYRTWFKNQEERPEVDEDFMGCSYQTNEGKKKKGFFNLFHGKKDNIERYLPSLLDIAEDNQAIYEFLQNAVDCDATHFWAFYNDQYFLAVNNGSKFSLEGLSSILNIAQSTKTTSSSIGRLGIGFKLAHRLVGKGNGTHELVHGNKGPIMFSWDKSSQLKSLMSSEDICFDGLNNNPFLLKIAITNFPANVGEVVKDVNYNEVVVFPESELKELRCYVAECLNSLYNTNQADFNQGTLFFIKLGKNKRDLLDADLATLKNGIEYSMNTLKQLNSICFNGESINKKNLVINDSFISHTSDKFKIIDPQYKEYDILYSFGFLPLNFSEENYYDAVALLRKSPNFYKYFPMGDEVDNMALFIHSDSFQIESNRRTLTNHHTNRELLPEIADFIITILNRYQTSDREKFLQLYASILLTDKPSSQEKSWMYGVFFDKLYAAIKSCIPTKDGILSDSSKVKIKKVNIDIPLAEIGHEDKQWFVWNGDNNSEIISEAVEEDKLGIEEWNINSIIKNANIDKLNAWLNTCSETLFDAFINEIKATTTSNEVKALLPQIKLFKFGKDRKSRNEIISDTNYVITTAKTVDIKYILEKVGMVCTDAPLENHPLSSLVNALEDKKLFANIKSAVEEKCSTLNASDKLALIISLSAFDGVAEGSLKQLCFFKNRKGNHSCLGKLVAYKETSDLWQLPYIICKEESFSELNKYMVSEEDIFNDIISDEYESIIEEGTTIDELYRFYQKNDHPWSSELTIKMINKYGASEDILDLIEKTSDKSSVEAFIKKMDPLDLKSDSQYAKTTYEYRCIQIASKVGATSLRSKINIDDIRLSNFASSDTLLFKVTRDNKESYYNIKLSDVLPDDTQCAIYGKNLLNFTSIPNYTTIFSADNSNIGNVSQRLQEILKPEGVLISPAQYAFILLHRASSSYGSLGFWSSYVRLNNVSQVKDIISYCYDNNLIQVLTIYKSIYPWRNYVEGKYLFSSEYTIEEERADKLIEDWCGTDDDDKKKALKALGMHFNDSAEIKRRIAFKNDSMSEWDGELKVFPSSFIHWIHSFSPVTQENQITLLNSLSSKFNNIYLKKEYYIEDYSNSIELNTDKYLKWYNSDRIKIYVLETEMPYRIMYNKTDVICHGVEGDFHYFLNERSLYIKGSEESEIAASLAQAYQDRRIPFTFEDFISVCSNSLEEQRKKDELLKEYERLFEQMGQAGRKNPEEQEREKEEYRQEYSKKIKEFMGSDFSMPADKIKSEHVIARYRALMYIKRHSQSFPIEPSFNEKDYVRTDGYAPIPLIGSKRINIQSAKFGIWYLHLNIWHDIVDNGNYACICTGNGDSDFIMIKDESDIKRIAESTNNVFMRMTPTPTTDIMETIKSVMNPNKIKLDDDIVLERIYTNRDVHLMLMVHQTTEPALNSIFDDVFKNEGSMTL